MKVASYVKTIVAVVGAAVVAVQAAITDGSITPSEAVQVALAVLAALGVYALPNAPKESTA